MVSESVSHGGALPYNWMIENTIAPVTGADGSPGLLQVCSYNFSILHDDQDSANEHPSAHTVNHARLAHMTACHTREVGEAGSYSCQCQQSGRQTTGIRPVSALLPRQRHSIRVACLGTGHDNCMERTLDLAGVLRAAVPDRGRGPDVPEPLRRRRLPLEHRDAEHRCRTPTARRVFCDAAFHGLRPCCLSPAPLRSSQRYMQSTRLLIAHERSSSETLEDDVTL